MQNIYLLYNKNCENRVRDEMNFKFYSILIDPEFFYVHDVSMIKKSD